MSLEVLFLRIGTFLGWAAIAFLANGCAYDTRASQKGDFEGGMNTATGTTSEFAEDKKIVAVGYAVIDVQKGQTHAQRRLMAIRASKLDAYRNMAEQVYGIFIETTSQMADLALESENTRGRVQGLVYGSQLVSIRPLGRESYETTLSLDESVLNELVSKFRNRDTQTHTVRSNLSFPEKTVPRSSERPRWNFRKRRWET